MASTSIFRKKPLQSVLQSGDPSAEMHTLNKVLTAKDLTFFGIAAIIGAGSFTSMGEACYKGGPGVVLLFLICAVACGFTALCYAEFASRVPVSGSAYTYAYVSFGELFAWIIGWALLMEYSIGNIYVAFSWSGYCNSLLQAFGIHIPDWLAINYKEAHRAFDNHAAGIGLNAWQSAPEIGGLKIIFDLPAVLINAFITWLVYIGTRESRNVTNAMVVIKLVILALVIIVGAFYVNIDNWHPFLPKGFGGVMAGASAVFFTYIGFDAVSTMAEECKDPQRDLPRGMIYSLVICTVLYIILSLVIIGMTSFQNLHVTDPLAEVFKLNLQARLKADPQLLLTATKVCKWMLFIVSVAAVIA
ncbi:MAG TPA: amino acid permease, partial [Bacteroidia bacterium]